MKCVITGCALISPYSGCWVAGDLFDGGTVWVFNGNYAGTDPAWLPTTHVPIHYSKHITPTDGNYFERRGVFVIFKDKATLNTAALEHIKEWA